MVSLPIGIASGIAALVILKRSLPKAGIVEANSASLKGLLGGFILLATVPIFYIFMAYRTDTTFLPGTIYLSSAFVIALTMLAAFMSLRALRRMPDESTDLRSRRYAYWGLAICAIIFGLILVFHFYAMANTDFSRAYWLTGQRSANYAEALDHFNRAIDLNPDYEDAYVSRAILYRQNGEYALEVEDLRTLVSRWPDARRLNQLAWTLVDVLDTNYEEALEHSIRAVQCDYCSDHSLSEYQATLAFIYYKMQSFENAVQHYDIALSLDSDNSTALLGRADAYLALGNIEVALSDYLAYESLGSTGEDRDYVERMIEELQNQ
jgi:tetratricopeptide (TPR) repeat protein